MSFFEFIHVIAPSYKSWACYLLAKKDHLLKKPEKFIYKIKPLFFCHSVGRNQHLKSRFSLKRKNYLIKP